MPRPRTTFRPDICPAEPETRFLSETPLTSVVGASLQSMLTGSRLVHWPQTALWEASAPLWSDGRALGECARPSGHQQRVFGRALFVAIGSATPVRPDRRFGRSPPSDRCRRTECDS